MRRRRLLAVSIFVLTQVTIASGLTGSLAPAAAQNVGRVGMGSWPISSMVRVPTGYDTIYVSGQTASSPGVPKTGDTEEQTMKSLTNIKTILEGQGVGMGDIVALHVFLVADQGKGQTSFDIAGMQRAYNTFFGTPDQPNRPARSTVQVAGLGDNGLVEIEAVAVQKR